MAKKGCLTFPFQEDTANQSLRRTTTINDTLKSSIRCFLVTAPGQRRGNNVGSFLTTLKHQILSSGELKVTEGKLKQELSNQFTGVNFDTVLLRMEKTDKVSQLRVTIQFSTSYTGQDNLTLLL